MRNQATGVPPALIWVLGLSLLFVVMLASSQWGDIWRAITTGQGVTAAKSATTWPVLWRLGGGLLLLFLLALWAQSSERGGVFAVTFLLILWAFYLVRNQQAVAGLLGKFKQANG